MPLGYILYSLKEGIITDRIYVGETLNKELKYRIVTIFKMSSWGKFFVCHQTMVFLNFGGPKSNLNQSGEPTLIFFDY